MASFHLYQEQLARHCRICPWKLRRIFYNCSKQQQFLLDCVAVNVEWDKPNVHPPKFCNASYTTLRKLQTALVSGTVFTGAFYLGTSHGLHQLSLLEVQMKGGSPKKQKWVLLHSGPCQFSCWTTSALYTPTVLGAILYTCFQCSVSCWPVVPCV